MCPLLDRLRIIEQENVGKSGLGREEALTVPETGPNWSDLLQINMNPSAELLK